MQTFIFSVGHPTSAEVLQWDVIIPHSTQGTFRRSLSYIGTLQMAIPISTALTTLYVSQSLDNSSSLPLISMISTGNTTADLNGTVITCSGLRSRPSQLLAFESVEIIVIRNNSDNVNSRFMLKDHC